MNRAICVAEIILLSCGTAICIPQAIQLPPGVSLQATGVLQQLPNIKGSPFSGQLIFESKGTLRDGTVIDVKRPMTQYRDGEGRTRREFDDNIVIVDPVAHVNYSLNRKTMLGIKGLRVPNPSEELLRLQAQEAFEEAKNQAGEAVKGPHVTYGPPVTTESLGTQEMEGLTVEGTRTTTMVRFGVSEDAPRIKWVQERWYSAELKMDVLSINDDPRQATVMIWKYTKIVRGEPDPALFRVPSGYSLKDPDKK
jgi:hypothetical protein